MKVEVCKLRVSHIFVLKIRISVVKFVFLPFDDKIFSNEQV